MRDGNGALIPFVVAARPGTAHPGGADAPGPAGGGAADGLDAAVSPARSAGASADWRAFGPLAPFVSRAGVTDVFVNGMHGLWVDQGAGARREPGWACGEDAVRELAVRLIAQGGRHVDEATPCVDVRLQHGIRIHVVLPPVSTMGTLISIRVPRAGCFTLHQLRSGGMLTDVQHQVLLQAIARRSNLLVTGAAGTGKTTLLAAALGHAPEHERILCIEDVAELRIDHPHVVSLEARQPNLEGAGAIDLARLVREALRMRPDRLVVGECRGAEVRELLAALNTGHDGGAGTVHANTLDDVPARLEALGALAELSPGALARQTVSAIDLVVHLERAGDVRRVASIGRFRVENGHLAVTPLGGATPGGDIGGPGRSAQ